MDVPRGPLPEYSCTACTAINSSAICSVCGTRRTTQAPVKSISLSIAGYESNGVNEAVEDGSYDARNQAAQSFRRNLVSVSSSLEVLSIDGIKTMHHLPGPYDHGGAGERVEWSFITTVLTGSTQFTKLTDLSLTST